MCPGCLLLLLLLPGSLAFSTWLPLPWYSGYTVKPGTCPVQQSDDLPCRQLCSQDASCPGSQKCCATSCGWQCTLPTGVISGYCPKVPLPPGQATICLANCTDDYDCAGGLPRKKCCNRGCLRTCVEAVEEHPGVCPYRPVVLTFAPCEDTCIDDRGCPLHQKCCFTGCSRGCLDSVRSRRCELRPETGPCRGALIRYYYSPAQKRCLQFTYGGCRGNSNNFRSREECRKACGRVDPEVCRQPPESGPCLAYFEVYVYNSTSKMCEPFIYGGCGGNDNRFDTKLECMIVCGRPEKSRED